MKPSDDQQGDVAFEALEYHADDTFHPARYAFRTSPGDGWRVEREGQAHLELGIGYRLLRSRACGVCSTDLDRRFLPFPLPQITGHEVVVEDDAGRRYVVEINASHAARGEAPCAFCAAGLETHCPSRLVLGIHDLPGGFGPWVLAPQHALVSLPDSVPDATAALVEPFAAALRAVTTIDPAPNATIAVLGPRRLGLLVVAALAAHRRRSGRDFEIVALARRDTLGALALELGADRWAQPPARAGAASPLADVVIDTTGAPEGLEVACALARREVHLKSTHGRPALGCAHLTEAVVDEIALRGVVHADEAALQAALFGVAGLCEPGRLRVGWLCGDAPPSSLGPDRVEIVRARNAADLLDTLEHDDSRWAANGERPTPSLPRVDALVLDDARGIDEALRPHDGREVSPLRPRGELVLRTTADAPPSPQPAIAHPLRSGLRISTSRCGDFREALKLISGDAELRRMGERLVSHRFDAGALREAFDAAKASDAIKVIVEHRGQVNLRSR